MSSFSFVLKIFLVYYDAAYKRSFQLQEYELERVGGQIQPRTAEHPLKPFCAMAEVPLKFPCHPALVHRVMANQNKVMIIIRMMVTMATMATTTMIISFCVNHTS